MKKALAILILTALLVFTLTGCIHKSTVPQNSEKKLKIAVTVFPVYDFVKNIFRDSVDVFMIVPPGNDSHSFEPTPNDIINLMNSDLFVYTGGASESWVYDVVESAGLDSSKTLALKDVVDLYSEDNHNHEDEYDEHIWTSPKNAVVICEKIFEKVEGLNSGIAEKCESYLNSYTEELKQLDILFKEIVEQSKRKTVIFGDRFPFLYFVKEYGLNYLAAFPGCASETEPSAATIAELTDEIRKNNIPVVFHIEFSNEQIADILCENTGAKKLLFHSCHSITKKQLEENISYIDIMKKNADNLREALN